MPAPKESEAAQIAPPSGWLVTVAQLPTEDPAARMRVLRTLESLGAAVMREGVYLLPETAGQPPGARGAGRVHRQERRRRARAAGGAALDDAQHAGVPRLFDRSARYEELIKIVESLRVGFGIADPSAISRVLHKQRREFEAIGALDFFPSAARERAQRRSPPPKPRCAS